MLKYGYGDIEEHKAEHRELVDSARKLQQEISERFAGRHTELQDRFAGLNTHTLVSGVPFLEDGLAFLDCKVIWNYEAATNTLFVGEVMSAQADPTTASPQHPLLYFNRAYRRMCD